MLLFLPEMPLEDDEGLGLEPDFIPTLDGQGKKRVCSLGSFIAYLPKMSRPSTWRRSTPFRDCCGYSRWEHQLDGCRGTPAALRRVEPLFGGSGSRPKNWIAAAYGGAVAFRG